MPKHKLKNFFSQKPKFLGTLKTFRMNLKLPFSLSRNSALKSTVFDLFQFKSTAIGQHMQI